MQRTGGALERTGGAKDRTGGAIESSRHVLPLEPAATHAAGPLISKRSSSVITYQVVQVGKVVPE